MIQAPAAGRLDALAYSGALHMTRPPNDNEPVNPDETFREPDAYGQAAMLLVESLLHSLIARSLLTLEDALEIVGIAADVKVEVADSLGDSPATMAKSLSLLTSISKSLSADRMNERGDSYDK